MLKEIVLVEDIEYELESDELFYGTLDIIRNNKLCIESIDYKQRTVSLMGNIKLRKKKELFEKTALCGSLGWHIADPFLIFREHIYADRLILRVRSIGKSKSKLFVSCRLNHLNTSFPIYNRSFNLYYDILSEDLKKIIAVKDSECLRNDIYGLIKGRNMLSLNWVILLMLLTLLIVLSKTIYDLFTDFVL